MGWEYGRPVMKFSGARPRELDAPQYSWARLRELDAPQYSRKESSSPATAVGPTSAHALAPGRRRLASAAAACHPTVRPPAPEQAPALKAKGQKVTRVLLRPPASRCPAPSPSSPLPAGLRSVGRTRPEGGRSETRLPWLSIPGAPGCQETENRALEPESEPAEGRGRLPTPGRRHENAGPFYFREREGGAPASGSRP